jgi:hypothetical protein
MSYTCVHMYNWGISGIQMNRTFLKAHQFGSLELGQYSMNRSRRRKLLRWHRKEQERKRDLRQLTTSSSHCDIGDLRSCTFRELRTIARRYYVDVTQLQSKVCGNYFETDVE